MDEATLIQHMFHLLTQLKLFHWTTMSFAKHKALDDLHSVLSDKVDVLVESYIGRFKKQPIKNFQIDVHVQSDSSKLERFLEEERSKLEAIAKQWKNAPELKNIVDEMAIELDKALYLCKLQ